MAYGDLIENLMRDFDLSEIEAQRINILGRVLRGQLRRRGSVRLREELHATWDDIKAWDIAWSLCLLRLAWLRLYGDFTPQTEVAFALLVTANQPAETAEALNSVIRDNIIMHLQNAQPEYTIDELSECAKSVLATAPQLAVAVEDSKAKYRKKQVSWTYDKPHIEFEFRPQKLSPGLSFDVTADTMKYGPSRAAAKAFRATFDFLVKAADRDSTHDTRMEDELQLRLSFKENMREAAQESSYKQLVEKFRPVLKTPFEIPFDYPGAERIECATIEQLVEAAGLQLRNRADFDWHWDWVLANIDQVQDMIFDHGYVSIRDSLCDGIDRFRLILFPLSDQYAIMAARRFATDELATWKQLGEKYPFRLRACDSDYFEATFTKRVDDASELAKQLMAWSHDVLDYGNETPETLASDIERCQRFWYWPEDDF